jgi:hypothetical protein
MKWSVIVLVLAAGAAGLSGETLTMSVPMDPKAPSAQPILKLAEAAFGYAGFDLVLKEYPGIRGLIEANAGRIDGDLGRIPEAISQAEYPDLVMVPEPITVTSNVAYSTKGYEVNSIDDIVSRNLTVVAYSGLKWAEVSLKPRLAPDKWIVAPENELALKVLLAGRADILVATDVSMKAFLALPAYSSVRVAGVLVTVKVYPYLNKKYAASVAKIAEGIRKFR